MLRLGFAISHGGAASLGATLRGGAASLGATLRGGAASLGAALRGGVASLDATLRGGAASLRATLRGGAASLRATLRGSAASLGAALSLGRRGTIPSASHDGGAVPSSGVALCLCVMPPSSYGERAVPSSSCGASVSCGGARVLALHARGAVVVVGIAVGAVAVVMGVAVAGVARSAGWGSRGSSCGVESSLAPLAES